MAARTDIPITALTAQASTADPAGTNVDATNNMNCAAGSQTNRLVFRIHNTTNAPKEVDFLAGVKPPAETSGIGQLAITPASASTVWVGPLESARFAQADGSININIASGMTGTITAFRLPKSF